MGFPKLAVLIPKRVFEWLSKNNKQEDPVVTTAFISSSGVKFEDIDPTFTAMISKAANFNPDNEDTEP